MRPFAYSRAADERDALRAAAGEGASFIAGGTELMQLWKLGVEAPRSVIDINALPFAGIAPGEGGITIGALARLADVAGHPAVRDGYGAIAEALLASASPQIRNVATIGGNLLQRTRCAYFRSSLPCNKREPGSGCGALDGENRLHALFGTSAHCVAAHASDLAVALVALDAKVRLRGANGERVMPLDELYLLPGNEPRRETQLAKGELIVEIELPRTALARSSRYFKWRDRASFEFAVVSIATALDVRDGVIRAARICAGGVGTKPWRLRATEAALTGAPPGEVVFRDAAAHAADGAKPLSQNGFKVELLRRSVFRALAEVGGQS
jgi:xanthine dehydrogenase YagS FAD-binding subunit